MFVNQIRIFATTRPIRYPMLYSLLKRNLLSISCMLLVLMPTFAQAQDDLYVEMADDMYAVNSKRLALEQYQLALFVNPNNVRAQYMAGICYYETIYRDQCLKHFLKAYELDPTISDSILFQIGEGYHLNNKFEEAISYYNKYGEVVDKRLAAKELNKRQYDRIKARIEQKIEQCKVGEKLSENPEPVAIVPIEELNTLYPDYAPSITKDEKTMVFTSRREGGVSPDVAIDLLYYEDIYIATMREDGTWGEPQIIPGINTITHESNLSISPDGTELLIYKDDNAGDIYYSDRNKKGEWNKPKPISNTINSEFKESSASISSDNQFLFFASDRPGGVGGFDIYMVERLKGNKWGAPINIGPPVNTPFDEDAPVLSFDGNTLFFASKGPGSMGEYDLFKSERDPVTGDFQEPVNLGYPINSSDDDRYYVQSIDGIHAYFASIKEGGEGDMDIFRIMPKEEFEKFYAKEMEEVEEEEPEEEPIEVTTVEVPDTSATEENIALAQEPEEDPKEKETITPEPQLETKKPEPKPITPINFQVKVSDEEGNLVDPSSIKLLDIAKNQKIDLNKTSTGVYTAEVTTEDATNFRLQVEKSGYMFTNEDITLPKSTPSNQQIAQNVQLRKIKVNRRQVLKNIYFDFDRAKISPESYDELNLVVQMMKENKETRIEIGGHTDSKGSDRYNKDLSQRRAQAVVNYLINKGIDRKRIVAKGYGEERPLASNDDEQEGRELNRRTEFTVLQQ